MVKIEAVIQPFKLDEVKAVIAGLGVQVSLISEVCDQADSAMQTVSYRGAEYHMGAPRLKLEMLVSSERADEVVEAILRVARSRVAGDDGMILVYDVADAIQIRTGAHLQYSLS